MKYLSHLLFIFSIPSIPTICSGFLLHPSSLLRAKPYPQNQLQVNINTPEYNSLTDLYKGINDHTIQQILISNDLTNVYYLSASDIAKKYHKVNTNSILTGPIIESAAKNEITATIMEKPYTLLDRTAGIANGLFSFALFSLAVSISINIVQNLFRRNKSNPMMQNPFLNMNPTEKLVDTSKINITLADWAGSPEILEECSEIVSYMKNADIYRAAGAEIPKGILLDGPPGTGKTLLAKAIAGETNSSFLSMSGSEFVELFVGMGASKVRALFEEARQNVPSIIFIDEIDAIGKKRGSSIMQNSNDEREQTLNQILSEMDGFSPNNGVIVIAATNRRDILDDALLRPGRFDRLVYVPLPDRASREAIFSLYLKNKRTTTDINVKYLAENTGGFSGAQIKNLLNEAAIFAARNGSIIITQEHMENALEKIIIGITKRVDTRSDAAKMRVAIHELGHAILAAVFNTDFELQKVSIKSTYTGIGGYTLFNEYPEVQESGLYTKNMLLKRIIIALGGKAAETLEYGDAYVSVGASEDLKQANQLAREMVERYGMGKSLEVFSVSNHPSQNMQYNVDKEIMDIVSYCYKEAKTILVEKTDANKKLLKLLLSDTVLDGATVSMFVNNTNSSL